MHELNYDGLDGHDDDLYDEHNLEGDDLEIDDGGGGELDFD